MTQPKTSERIAYDFGLTGVNKLWLPADDYHKLKALYDDLMENFKRMDNNTISKERVEEFRNKIKELIMVTYSNEDYDKGIRDAIKNVNEQIDKILLKGEK